MVKIYNTLSGKKEPLPEQKNIRLFVCGQTVYDYLHVGNARTYIFFDFFAKYLRAEGYDVEYVQNVTDIDDKIIKRAAEEDKKPEEIAKFFTKAYREDMKALGVDAVNEYAPATKFITQIVAQVERLIDKGFGYKIEDDGWYFDISKDADYGKLSHRTAGEAEDAISRIDEGVGKRNKGDFCLWKFSKPGEPTWPGRTLGAGRPGWHIEDTAISEYFFGPQYEIHGGGVDLKFPHHEAEIAQQESASGLKPFVSIWMHTGALLVDGKKMSKSLSNFITVRNFLKKYPQEVLRLMVFQHHYRSPIDYSEKAAGEAKKALWNVASFVRKQEMLDRAANHEAEMPKKFISALADDLNTSQALASLFESVNELQERPANKDGAQTAKMVQQGFHVFGISLPNPKIPKNIKEMVKEREQSRVNKQFEHSDRLRKEMNDLGYEVEDTAAGPFVWPKLELWQPSNQN